MSYEDKEKGVATAKPVELYAFICGGDVWRYNSGDSDVEYFGQTYEAETITRGELEVSDAAFRNELEIKIDRDNLFAKEFLDAPIDGIIEVIIYRGHEDSWIVFYKGIVAAITFNTEEVTINCTPKTTSLLRTGLRRKYQKQCNHYLYGDGCGVHRGPYAVLGTVDSFDGLSITSSEFATKVDGWFVGGIIAVGTVKRMITTHTTDTITISRRIGNLKEGDSFTAYAGCNHTMETCRTKFDNLINYGGQPWIPTKNPFTDSVL